MELTQEQIVEAFGANPELLQGVTTHIIESEKGKEIVNNRAVQIYDQRIGDEVQNIHSRYDEDAFSAIGEKPGVGEDGKKVKTYDFIKSKLTELKGLREIKDSLNKEAEVQRLNGRIAELEKGGGGAHWENTYNTALSEWKSKETGYQNQIKSLNDGIYSSTVQSQITSAKSGLKFNPDIPQAAIDAMFNTVSADLIKNSKKDGEKIVFLKPDGSAIVDGEYKPANASFIIKERMKDVLLNENPTPGGGAQETIVGSISTKKVEGKDEKSLILDKTKFSNRVEFRQVAMDTLKAEGITRDNADFQKLLDRAYVEYDIATLPRS